jgi:CheY-like chemotaxis protein
MEILHHKDLNKKDPKELLGYLPYVKLSLKEWLFVDIRLTEAAENLSIEKVAEIIRASFKSREGKLYICNEREILMLVRWGKNNPASIVADTIGAALPKEGCQVFVHEPTLTGVSKLEVSITYKKPASAPTYADARATRRENVVVVADDDMYMRMLVKKGAGPNATIVEVADGSEVLAAYQKSVPDIIFLDIHMPGMNGSDVLQQILAVDPSAYIVMLSADSSRENVESTAHIRCEGLSDETVHQGKAAGIFDQVRHDFVGGANFHI